jgi:exonuclease III
MLYANSGRSEKSDCSSCYSYPDSNESSNSSYSNSDTFESSNNLYYNSDTIDSINSSCNNYDENLSITECFSIASVNTCGLLSKLNLPEFTDFIKLYDIICINETKLDELDIINVNVEGYDFLSLNRKKITRKSGGIGVFVKSEYIEKKLVIKETNQINKNVLWFKLDKKLCGVDIICGALYIEPESSKYARNDVFDNLEDDICNYMDKNVMLIGDFNARVGNVNDLHVGNSFNVNDICYEPPCDSKDILLECGAKVKRTAKDIKVNSHGRKLVDICKQSDIVILNGRVGSDAYIGELTCKSKSTVDYCISSPRLIQYVQDFKVLDFNECLSDVHCPIVVKLNKLSISDSPCKNNVSPGKKSLGNIIRPKWDEVYTDIFKNNLSYNQINAVCDLIDVATAKPGCSQDEIDVMYVKIKNILYDSAVACGSLKKKQ